MKFDRRWAAGAGVAALLLWWLAAASRRPPRIERAFIVPRGAAGAVPDQPGVAPTVASEASGLEAPAPVLRRSAERRFSNPESSGGADGGLPGETRAASAARLEIGGASMPGGYGAPTAGGGSSYGGAVGGGPPGSATTPAGKASDGERTAKSDVPAAGGKPRDSGAPEDKSLTGTAGNLAEAARSLKNRGDIAALRAGAGFEAGLLRGLEQDAKVDAGIRKGIADLQSSGQQATPEAVAKIAEGVLKDNGLTPADVNMDVTIARASAPPGTPATPAALSEAVKNMSSTPPLEPWMQEELNRLADKPPPPRSPPPKGAIDAFVKYKSTFEAAHREFGVRPEDDDSILGIETTWGRNQGTYPIVRTLELISQRTDSQGRRTRAAIQAENDLKALARLAAQDKLGGMRPSEIKASYAGAMSPAQCLPSSCEAYSRSPDGSKPDPFDFKHAIFFVASYLKAHNYAKSVPGSILGYNHSQEYVNKVMKLSADIKPGIEAAAKTPDARAP